MSKNSDERRKIRAITMNMGIVDTGEMEGFFASPEDEKSNIKTYLICSVCGGIARSYTSRGGKGYWCLRCKKILPDISKISSKRICVKLEIGELFLEKDIEFLKALGVEI